MTDGYDDPIQARVRVHEEILLRREHLAALRNLCKVAKESQARTGDVELLAALTRLEQMELKVMNTENAQQQRIKEGNQR